MLLEFVRKILYTTAYSTGKIVEKSHILDIVEWLGDNAEVSFNGKEVTIRYSPKGRGDKPKENE